MAFTSVEICANALVRLGATPIQSFNEGTDIATSCQSIYKMKKAYMLAAYPWRFTKKFAQLSRLTQVPKAQWSYQFNLPSDRVTSGLPTVFISDDVDANPIQDYTIIGNVLMSDEPELWIEYQEDVDESLWAPYFTELMVSIMMVELSFLIADNASLRQELTTMTYGIPSEFGVGGIYGKAMALDSRDNPTIQVLDDILLEARFGGGAV